MLTCPMYEAPVTLASASASASQKETMMPSPASGSVRTWKPSKPRCRFKIGPRPRATRVTSAFISGGSRTFVTLAYISALLSEDQATARHPSSGPMLEDIRIRVSKDPAKSSQGRRSVRARNRPTTGSKASCRPRPNIRPPPRPARRTALPRDADAHLPGVGRALTVKAVGGGEAHRYIPRVTHEETALALLRLDVGRQHPLAHGGDFPGILEHHRPVAKADPALRNGRYTFPAPDVEAEKVVVAARGDERGRVWHILHQLEAQHVAVEGNTPLEVADVQVHVADRQPGTGLIARLFA